MEGEEAVLLHIKNAVREQNTAERQDESGNYAEAINAWNLTNKALLQAEDAAQAIQHPDFDAIKSKAVVQSGDEP